MILQFGKYKGRDVRDVPEDYLRWIIDHQQKTLNDYQAEIIRRQSLLDARLSWAERLVQAGYRSLALKYHPDRGGDNESMQQVIAAQEKLKELIQRSNLT